MPCEHHRPIDSLAPKAADKLRIFDGMQISQDATKAEPAATCEKAFNDIHLVTQEWVARTCLTDKHAGCPLQPPTAGSLIYHGEQPKQLEKDQWGIPNDSKHFTTDEIVQALSARTCLYLQMDPEDPDLKGKMPTCDIEVLLRTKELVKTKEGLASLFVDEEIVDKRTKIAELLLRLAKLSDTQREEVWEGLPDDQKTVVIGLLLRLAKLSKTEKDQEDLFADQDTESVELFRELIKSIEAKQGWESLPADERAEIIELFTRLAESTDRTSS